MSELGQTRQSDPMPSMSAKGGGKSLIREAGFAQTLSPSSEHRPRSTRRLHHCFPGRLVGCVNQAPQPAYRHPMFPSLGFRLSGVATRP
jgi:hypothetical protein